MTTVPFTPPNAEADFLLTCARVHLQEAQNQHLNDMLRRPLDWHRLVMFAARHGLRPLLNRHLQAHRTAALPAAVLEQLRAHQRQVALRNLGLAGELVRLLQLFSEHDIPVLPFKGPALAQFAYGDLSLREFGDLDLLLRPRDLLRARALLAERGFRAQYSLTPAQEAAHLHSQGQIPLEKESHGVVELHAALAPRAFAFDLELRRLWPRRCVVNVTGQPIAAPGAEDMVLILCMHGAKHLWKNLGWLCDVAELLRAQPSLNWEQVRREARRLRCERLLGIGLQLAEDLLQAPLPPDMSRESRCDREARTLADQVSRRLFDDAEWTPGGPESAMFHLRSRECWRDGMRFSLSLLLTPTLADWTVLPLPPQLKLLYYGARPLRLVRKYLRLGD